MPGKMVSLTEFQKIGVGLVGFGLFFIFFGVLLYFDSVLLAFGNLLFLSGLAIIIGLRRTFSFFFQKEKLKGTSFFLGGILIVLLRWPLLGMLLETYGFITLFRNFFPVIFGFLGALGNIPLLSKNVSFSPAILLPTSLADLPSSVMMLPK
nr:vesicle transport protein GOT1A-like isoform X2 [Caretta caretta]